MKTGDFIPVDQLDRRIIGELVKNARITIRSLADAVSLSSSATSDRLRRLESSGAITGYHAEVSPDVDGRTLEAIVSIRAKPDADRSQLEDWMAKEVSITEALHATGPHDYVLRLRCANTAELDNVLMTMKSDADVGETETRIVLRSIQLPEGRH